MDFTLFVLNMQMFHKEFGLDTSPEGRADKLFEEVNEFATAMQYESPERADDEAIDVLVCAIANVVSRGIKNPLHACYEKLERTAEKYRGLDQ